MDREKIRKKVIEAITRKLKETGKSCKCKRALLPALEHGWAFVEIDVIADELASILLSLVFDED